MNEQIKFGIVIADADEYKPLENWLIGKENKGLKVAGRCAHSFNVGKVNVISVLCGIGKVNAAVATTALAEQGVQIIFNCGLSGGVSGISKNEITVPDKFLEHDFDLSCIGYKHCQKPGQDKYIYTADKELSDMLLNVFENGRVGTAVSGDCFVQNEQLRTFLKEEFTAMSCDMETAAIAYVCDTYGVKFACVRKISDDAGNDAAESYREVNALSEDILIKGILEVIGKIAEKN